MGFIMAFAHMFMMDLDHIHSPIIITCTLPHIQKYNKNQLKITTRLPIVIKGKVEKLK
jgi:hypothetical protein